MLALPYKKYLYRFDGDFQVNGKVVRLATPESVRRTDEAENGDTGVAVWDAAVFLALFLGSNPSYTAGKVVLELGSGLGLGGQSAFACGAKRVFLTDLEYILPTTLHNIELNKGSPHISAVPLDWCDPDTCKLPWADIETVIASDTIWLEQLVEPFVKTLAFITDQNKNITILMANQRRSDLVWNKFLLVAHPLFNMHQVADDANLHIMCLARR